MNRTVVGVFALGFVGCTGDGTVQEIPAGQLSLVSPAPASWAKWRPTTTSSSRIVQPPPHWVACLAWLSGDKSDLYIEAFEKKIEEKELKKKTNIS